MIKCVPYSDTERLYKQDVKKVIYFTGDSNRQDLTQESSPSHTKNPLDGSKKI